MGSVHRHIELANGRLALAVDLDDGAKVVSLRCLRHGREWLSQRRDDLPPSAEGTFGARESWGWDELFPTVLPGPGAPPPWEAPLRDHGELWGRAWQLVERSGERLVARYEDAGGRFELVRALTLEGDGLRADYRVVNGTSSGLPFLWSMHPILGLTPGERLVLPGVDAVHATYVSHPRLDPGEQRLGWPVADAGVELDRVTAPDGSTALKLYAEPAQPPSVAVEGARCRLRLRALGGGPVTAIGLYLNYGGWPGPGSPLHQVGLEPTTAGVDHLAAAGERRRAAYVDPGSELGWGIELRLDSVEP